MTVKEITLLSTEDYEKYEPIIPVIRDDRWWLRSPSYDQDRAVFVLTNGSIHKLGYGVYYCDSAVRPALILELEVSNNLFWYKPERLVGTKIKYGNYKWTILDADFGELYVLCDELIARHRFDPKSNDWDKSELKQWLETEGMKLITG